MYECMLGHKQVNTHVLSVPHCVCFCFHQFSKTEIRVYMSGVHVLDLAVICSFVFFVLVLSPDDQLSFLHIIHSSSVPHLQALRSQPRSDWTGLDQADLAEGSVDQIQWPVLTYARTAVFSFHRRRRQLLLPGEKQNCLGSLRKENSHGSRPGSELCGKNVILWETFVFALKKLSQSRNGGHSLRDLEILAESFSQKSSAVCRWSLSCEEANGTS